MSESKETPDVCGRRLERQNELLQIVRTFMLGGKSIGQAAAATKAKIIEWRITDQILRDAGVRK